MLDVALPQEVIVEVFVEQEVLVGICFCPKSFKGFFLLTRVFEPKWGLVWVMSQAKFSISFLHHFKARKGLHIEDLVVRT